jgi:hypothetical protein
MVERRYYYLRLRDEGFNIKTAPLYTRYIKTFEPIHVDENKVRGAGDARSILEPFNQPGNVIVFYQQRDMTPFKNLLVTYLNSMKDVHFEFYLFTFDFWRPTQYARYFDAKNFRVFTPSMNIAHLNHFLLRNLSTFANNILFHPLHCCYNEAIMPPNPNPTMKLYVSGEHHPLHYPERACLHRLARRKTNIVAHPVHRADITSAEFAYNRRLHAHFACFASSVYMRGENTHAILLKIYEILGAGALLVMPTSEGKFIKNIGLVNMVNCYLIDFRKPLSPQIDCIFANVAVFERVRAEGHRHARENLNEELLIGRYKRVLGQPL